MVVPLLALAAAACSHPDVWGAGEHSRLGPVVTQLLEEIGEE